jgi:hypothetical protein
MIFQAPMVEGLRLFLTKHGCKELDEIGIDRWKVAEILTKGWDCSRSKRREGTIERCLDWGQKVIRAVAIRGPFTLEGEIGEAYYLIHVSIESRKKGRFRQEGE